MYYIDDYRKKAIEKMIPYLIEFPQIVKIVESSADRYQAIEDVLWKIANNFKVSDSRGVFLTAHANNEVTNIIYTDKAKDAFTFGTDAPLYQAYGTGHYYSQGSYISGIKKSVSEDKLIRAVQSKIIQNNTSGTVEDIIEALKLLYNAEHVKVYESYPLNLSIMLVGGNLEISSSGNYENIKQFVPACVKFNNIFVDTSMFDIFQYDTSSSYGDSRYPIRVQDSIDKYNYISFSVNLDSEFKEYVKTNHEKFDDNMYVCVCGQFTKINNDATLISSCSSVLTEEEENDENVNEESDILVVEDILDGEGDDNLDGNEPDDGGNDNEDDDEPDDIPPEDEPSTQDNINGFRVKISEVDGVNYLSVQYNDQLYVSEHVVNEEDRYAVIVYNKDNKLMTWFVKGTPLNGELYPDNDVVFNRVNAIEPDILIEGFTTVDAPMYINCMNKNDEKCDFADFTYYAITFGNMSNQEAICTEYYASCYGEKQFLFNCLENKNHLDIYTNNPLVSNIMTKQSYYNYKKNFSAGKYLYLDGKSGIDYYINENDIECNIVNADIEFDICMPNEISTGPIVSNFINNQEDNANIYFDSDGALHVRFIVMEDYAVEEDVTESIPVQYDEHTGSNVIQVGEYASFKVSFTEQYINIYKNSNLIHSIFMSEDIKNLSKTLKIGYDNDLNKFYKGFIKNVKVSVNTNIVSEEDNSIISEYNINLNMPYDNKLKDLDNKFKYTNFGARFLTVPQLINDKTNLDLYGNELISIRSRKE